MPYTREELMAAGLLPPNPPMGPPPRALHESVAMPLPPAAGREEVPPFLAEYMNAPLVGPEQQAELARTSAIQGRQLQGAALMGPQWFQGMQAAHQNAQRQQALAQQVGGSKLNRALDTWTTLQRQKELAAREEAEREFRMQAARAAAAKAEADARWKREKLEDEQAHDIEMLKREIAAGRFAKDPAEKTGKMYEPLLDKAADWAFPSGEQPHPRLTYGEAMDRGGRPIKSDHRKVLMASTRLLYDLDKMQDLIPYVFSKQGGPPMIKQGLRNWKRYKYDADPKLNLFYSMLSNLVAWARAAGEVGNIARTEQEIAALALPLGWFESEDSAKAKLDRSKELVHRGLRIVGFDPQEVKYYVTKQQPGSLADLDPDFYEGSIDWAIDSAETTPNVAAVLGWGAPQKTPIPTPAGAAPTSTPYGSRHGLSVDAYEDPIKRRQFLEQYKREMMGGG